MHRDYDKASHDWMSSFKDNFSIDVISVEADQIVFEMCGIDASLANALRRIMIAELPTMAIENVFVYDNTSVIQVYAIKTLMSILNNI